METQNSKAPVWATKDVAAHFNISEDHVVILVETEGLPCIKVSPKRWRYVPAEVVAWGEARRVNKEAQQ